MRKVLHYLLLLAVQVVITGVVLYLFLPLATERLRPQLLGYMAESLPEDERQRMYERIAASFGGAWDTTPDPAVARLGKRGWTGAVKQAAVQMNNAGLRSAKPFRPRTRGVFRIICLGDSFVFGHGGREQDRFCDQLEDFYSAAGIEVDGQPIETYAVGLGSWTLAQESTYLSRRIGEYEPDLVVMLSAANDITESQGVTGAGVLTRDFSAESRRWGSGLFHNTAGRPFGGPGYSGIQWDLSSSSGTLWEEGLAALSRLVALQHRRGGQILLSTLNPTSNPTESGAAFSELFKTRVRAARIEAPLLEVTYLRARAEMRLPHDNHPSRAGHRLLRDQYVHALDALGWVEVPAGLLPELERKVTLKLDDEPDEEIVAAWRQDYVERYLRESLDFSALSPNESNAFLGGIFPASKATPFADLPWASVRTGFLLSRPANRQGKAIRLVIEIPKRIELFPFRLEVLVDGRPAGELDVATMDDAGEHLLEVAMPLAGRPDVVELVLLTDSYFTGIEDGRMKSYRLVSARIL